MGLWYPKDTGFKLTAFSDSDHAGCLDSRKSTSGGIQFLRAPCHLVQSSPAFPFPSTSMSDITSKEQVERETQSRDILEIYADQQDKNVGLQPSCPAKSDS
ncbi:hypothetical protein Tco_0746955 [Tanacetum coccineum]